MNATAIAILSILAVIVAFGSRAWALLGMMAGVLFTTYGLGLDILGLNIYSMRVLAVVGFLRVLFRKEFSIRELNDVDRAFFFTYIYVTAIFLIRSSLEGQASDVVTQVSTMGKVGWLADSVLFYATFRGLVHGTNDLVVLLRRLVFLLIPFVGLVWMERQTGINPFAAIGAIPNIWVESGGRMRCFGSFAHPSLLGTLGASLLPLYIGLSISEGHRAIAISGAILSLGVVVLAASGGPLNFVGVVLAGWFLWRIRRHRAKFMRWIVVTLILLWIAMYIRNQDHIWWLPAKLSRITGGNGWHRSYLMDVAIRNLDQWWLVGMPLDLTRDWFVYLVGGAADITNYYLLIGFDSGIIGIVLFSVLLIRGFRFTGLALTSLADGSQKNAMEEAMTWALGVALAGHVANWFAITYFDQTNAIWCMQIAAISGLSLTVDKAHRGTELRAEDGSEVVKQEQEILTGNRGSS